MLQRVEKPGRYIGGEWGTVKKDWATSEVKIALAFPDLYEVGQSHLGLRLLYHRINDEADLLAERVFAPAMDLEALLRQNQTHLFSLDSWRPLYSFDIIGFTLQYELSYTNILNMMDLGGVSLYAHQRGEHDPWIIGGGPGAFNPEPIADFFDLFFLGEGEDGVLEIARMIAQAKTGGWSRQKTRRALASIQGVYVPSLYAITYHVDGTVAMVTASEGAPERVKKRIVNDFDRAYLPEQDIVPFTETVHDRIMLELFRGCTRGCRFCQAGMIYRPVRERSPETVENALGKFLRNTGYEEVSLTSLSSSDYTKIHELIERLMGCYGNDHVNFTLPSLRIDAFPVELAKRFQGGRKASLTFAPEAGTERMRRVINKGVTEDDMLAATEAAVRGGWQRLKLYFMIGLPTETLEDVEGIVELVKKVQARGRSVLGKRAHTLQISVSVSNFVPKPHTPFQWRSQLDSEAIRQRQQFLSQRISGKGLEFHWHDVTTSLLEGVFSRGDRRLGETLFKAWELGCRFDGWSEFFRPDLWEEAFEITGLSPSFYTIRQRPYEELLPWEHLDSGVSRQFLIAEDRRAESADPTLDCRTKACPNCGVCSSLGVRTQLARGDRHA